MIDPCEELFEPWRTDVSAFDELIDPSLEVMPVCNIVTTLVKRSEAASASIWKNESALQFRAISTLVRSKVSNINVPF